MNLTDQLNHVSPVAVTRAGVAVVDTLTDFPKATQIQVLAMLNILVCEEFGRDVRSEMERANRVAKDGDGVFKPEVRALRAYINGELK